MKPTYLDKIRAAVIAAVPEKAEASIYDRDVTLADVLLAIGTKYPFKPMQVAEFYLACDLWGNLCNENGVDEVKWNLRKNLEDQEEPVLEFLAELLESK